MSFLVCIGYDMSLISGWSSSECIVYTLTEVPICVSFPKWRNHGEMHTPVTLGFVINNSPSYIPSIYLLIGYIHRSCYYHHQIGSINLTNYHIFPWLCAWDACYIIFCHLLHIQSVKTGILFSLLLCSLWWVQIVGSVLACRSCSFVCTLHHLIIIIVQTYLKTLNL